MIHKGMRITNMTIVEKAIEDFNSVQKHINDLLIKNNYLDKLGMVNFSSFEGDGSTSIRSSDIINKMKKEGLISHDLELVQINPTIESE